MHPRQPLFLGNQIHLLFRMLEGSLSLAGGVEVVQRGPKSLRLQSKSSKSVYVSHALQGG